MDAFTATFVSRRQKSLSNGRRRGNLLSFENRIFLNQFGSTYIRAVDPFTANCGSRLLGGNSVTNSRSGLSKGTAGRLLADAGLILLGSAFRQIHSRS